MIHGNRLLDPFPLVKTEINNCKILKMAVEQGSCLTYQIPGKGIRMISTRKAYAKRNTSHIISSKASYSAIC
jgi:hypothetical protein